MADIKNRIINLLPSKEIIRNRIITLANAIPGINLKQVAPIDETITKMPIYKELVSKLDFQEIGTLNSQMVETERNWDGSPGEHIESVDEIRKQLIEIYCKDTDGDFTESIGPFSDVQAITEENTALNFGTVDLDKLENENMKIKHRSGTVNVDAKFTIPSKRRIYWNDGRYYDVSYMGYQMKENWERLHNEISKICQDYKNALTTQYPDKSTIIDGQIKNIHKYINGITGLAQSYIQGLENKHRSNLKGHGGVIKRFQGLKSLKEELYAKKLSDKEIFYQHTFKVAMTKIPAMEEYEVPKIIEEGKDEGDIATESDGTIIMEKKKRYKIDDQGNMEFDFLKDHVPGGENWKRAGEMEVGQDKHGWPLEVGDDSTLFDGKILKQGKVLIDIYEHGSSIDNAREVPSKFITDCDILDVASWIYVYYDGFRDDLRDGRYHPGSISAMERIMTELGYPEHNQTVDDLERGKHAIADVRLNKLNPVDTAANRFTTDPDTVKMQLSPSQISPAFDLREKSKTIHLGRKYYYETQAENQLSDKATITTRGAALYILHRVIEETKTWGGPGNEKAGVVELMEAIGKQTGGFDIGANMGPDLKGWGKPLSTNPFRPRGR